MYGLTVVFKIINCHINCSEVLELLDCDVLTRNLRQYSIFRVEQHRVLYDNYSCVSRLTIASYKISDSVDFFMEPCQHSNVHFCGKIQNYLYVFSCPFLFALFPCDHL